jgi:hypothetical protein
VQRYGDGRSMIFAGEAAWRWRMMLPASDRSYDTFWRQAVRWLAVAAPDPLNITAPAGSSPGDAVTLRVNARSPTFEPLADVSVDVRITAPDGTLQQVRAASDTTPDAAGRYVAQYRPEHAGVYRVVAEARRGEQPAGTATTTFLVGGADEEMTDPHLNERLLQRLTSSSHGRMVDSGKTDALVEALRAGVPAAALSVRRDLWHTGWSFTVILLLLSAEWLLRRWSGLR